MTQYQSDYWVKQEATKMLKQNPKRRISATFRTLRAKSYLSLLGDYVIFAGIMYAMRDLKIKTNREPLVYAMSFSEEFKNYNKGYRVSLADQLLDLLKK